MQFFVRLYRPITQFFPPDSQRPAPLSFPQSKERFLFRDLFVSQKMILLRVILLGLMVSLIGFVRGMASGAIRAQREVGGDKLFCIPCLPIRPRARPPSERVDEDVGKIARIGSLRRTSSLNCAAQGSGFKVLLERILNAVIYINLGNYSEEEKLIIESWAEDSEYILEIFAEIKPFVEFMTNLSKKRFPRKSEIDKFVKELNLKKKRTYSKLERDLQYVDPNSHSSPMIRIAKKTNEALDKLEDKIGHEIESFNSQLQIAKEDESYQFPENKVWDHIFKIEEHEDTKVFLKMFAKNH